MRRRAFIAFIGAATMAPVVGARPTSAVERRKIGLVSAGPLQPDSPLILAFTQSLRELGYDRLVEQAAQSIPDARERLTYVATMTERAAERVLNATDAARPLQDEMGATATGLAGDWRRVYAGQMGVDEFKALAGSTLDFLERVPQHTKATSAQLMEIVMAQDFQDLTGQVIKRINELAHYFEEQLLKLLIESTPEDQRPPGSEGLLNGPVVNPDRAGDVAHTQAQVDDLLESLGF